jgi:hypothetical protein
MEPEKNFRILETLSCEALCRRSVAQSRFSGSNPTAFALGYVLPPLRASILQVALLLVGGKLLAVGQHKF